MGSKQVLDDGKRADGVIESARTNAKEIARRRATQYTSLGIKHAPTAAAIEAEVIADADALSVRRDALRGANRVLETELGDDVAVFAERDRAAGAVRAILVEFRSSVHTNCGDTAVIEMGFAGETPRDPVALEALGGAVSDKVAKSPPKARRRGVRFDAKAAIEGLDAEVTALARANADVRREKREEQLARQRRDEAWALFERELAATTTTLDGRLRAVGLEALAERLVPTTPAGGADDEGGHEPA